MIKIVSVFNAAPAIQRTGAEKKSGKNRMTERRGSGRGKSRVAGEKDTSGENASAVGAP